MLARRLFPALLLTSAICAQGSTPLDIPAYVETEFSGLPGLPPYTTGFFFQAPQPFRINGARVPDEVRDGAQTLQIILSPTRPPETAPVAIGNTVFSALLRPSQQIVQVGVTVQAGDWVCVLGACGSGPLLNSVGSEGPFPSHIFGMPVSLERLEASVDITANSGPTPIQAGGVSNRVGRIELFLDRVPGAASAVPLGTGCGGDGPMNFYEEFEFGSRPADLGPGQGLRMTLGSPSYTVTSTSNGYVAPRNSLGLGNDEIRRVALPNPMPTPFGTTSDLWVSANGFVALQQPPTGAVTAPDLAALLDEPFARVCPFWADLDPDQSGFTFLDTVGAVVRVTWADVPIKNSRPPQLFTSTFQCSFDTSTGTIEFNYRQLALADALIGFSPGSGAVPGGRFDLSQTTRIELGTGRPDLQLVSVSRPVLGTTAAVELRDIPVTSAAAVFLLGLNQTRVSLDPIGMPGCLQFVLPVGALSAQVLGDSATLSLPIPSSALSGADAFVQAVTLTPGANPLGILSSNAIVWTLGTL